jgi:hypothetical protein
VWTPQLRSRFPTERAFAADVFDEVLELLVDHVEPAVAAIVIPVPSPKAVRDLLRELLDRDVEVAPGEPVVGTVVSPAAMGVYVDDRVHLAAVVSASLPLVAHVGACFGLFSLGSAVDAVKDAEVPEAICESFAEVLGLMASMFAADGVPPVRLWSWHPPGQVAPLDVLAYARSIGRRLDLHVAVAGYGSGGLSVVAAT